MKKIIGILIAILISFSLKGQEIDIKNKDYWENTKPNFELKKPIFIDTIEYCKPDSLKENKLFSKKLKVVKHSNYIYNFTGHISASVGIKLADLSTSKIRVEWESDLKSENFTIGTLLSLYTLKYYYNGWKIEAFSRYYFVPNSSGQGTFIQFRVGTGRFQNKTIGKSFVSSGLGVDVGNKFILVDGEKAYRNAFTMSPMGGIQFYNFNRMVVISWIWQLRFGYQF